MLYFCDENVASGRIRSGKTRTPRASRGGGDRDRQRTESEGRKKTNERQSQSEDPSLHDQAHAQGLGTNRRKVDSKSRRSRARSHDGLWLRINCASSQLSGLWGMLRPWHCSQLVPFSRIRSSHMSRILAWVVTSGDAPKDYVPDAAFCQAGHVGTLWLLDAGRTPEGRKWSGCIYRIGTCRMNLPKVARCQVLPSLVAVRAQGTGQGDAAYLGRYLPKEGKPGYSIVNRTKDKTQDAMVTRACREFGEINSYWLTAHTDFVYNLGDLLNPHLRKPFTTTRLLSSPTHPRPGDGGPTISILAHGAHRRNGSQHLALVAYLRHKNVKQLVSKPPRPAHEAWQLANVTNVVLQVLGTSYGYLDATV
ncbi:hypothetical protein CHU98_g2673 [Xylaria longipes]|nr:hypothetical protein CHU98_g2673 [Xylaria longipes]